jgi:hypothetical protein
MANSYVEYTTAGTGTNGLGQTTFTAPTKFLSINDIRAKGYNGSTWTELTISSRGTNTVTLSAVPSAYSKVRIYRATTSDQLIDFQAGARLAESDLDTAYNQGLYVAQEVSEDAGAIGTLTTGVQNITLGGTTSVDNLTASGTVQIPSGTDANHFYREGTFTATLSGTAGTAGSVAGNTNSFQFVKIGNMCFINGSFTVTNAGSYSASLQLTGLPYTAKNTGVSGFGIVLNRFSLNGGNTSGNTSASVNSNTTTMSFNYSASGNNVPWTSLDLNTVFALGGWYQIA